MKRIEKRRYPRYDFVYRVVYSPSENPYKETETKSFNISLGGIGIRLSEFISGAGTLNLKIYPRHKRMPVTARGRIVWQGYSPVSGEKRAGIQFKEISMSKIKRLLENT